jgi:hypothetical protein
MSEKTTGKKQRGGRLFKPGQSGNPNGRPKGSVSLTVELRKQLSAKPELKEEIIDKVIELATAGNLDAIKLAWDRIDGRPKQEVAATVVTHTPVDLSKLSDDDLDLIHEKLATALTSEDDDSDSDD